MIERLQRSASGNVRFAEARAPLLQVGPPKDRMTVKLNFPELSNGPRGVLTVAFTSWSQDRILSGRSAFLGATSTQNVDLRNPGQVADLR